MSKITTQDVWIAVDVRTGFQVVEQSQYFTDITFINVEKQSNMVLMTVEEFNKAISEAKQEAIKFLPKRK